MKKSRLFASLLAFTLSTAALVSAAPTLREERALPRCPRFFCPISIEGECLCEWVVCEDGSVHCGRP
jgi:hypothetical protein